MSKRQVKLEGKPLELYGQGVEPGQTAPEFKALDNELDEVSLSSFKGKVIVISSVPSLDTPVCDTQTRRFNQAASDLGDDVVILTLSMDLPFAQKRWCAAAGVDRVITLSDHRDAEFGKLYGMLIPDLRLLARGVFVLDREATVRYFQLVEEVTNEPDYDEVLRAVKEIA